MVKFTFSVDGSIDAVFCGGDLESVKISGSDSGILREGVGKKKV